MQPSNECWWRSTWAPIAMLSRFWMIYLTHSRTFHQHSAWTQERWIEHSRGSSARLQSRQVWSEFPGAHTLQWPDPVPEKWCWCRGTGHPQWHIVRLGRGDVVLLSIIITYRFMWLSDSCKIDDRVRRSWLWWTQRFRVNELVNDESKTTNEKQITLINWKMIIANWLMVNFWYLAICPPYQWERKRIV